MGNRMGDAIHVLISTIASGGLVGALVSWYAAKKKVPVERDSIIVTGATSAVTALQAVVEAESKRADRAEARVAELEAQLHRKDERIEALEFRLDIMQAALDEAREELRSIREYGEG